MPDRLPAGTVRVPDNVVYRAFESQTVLLNLDTGRYHGLNTTAGRILELVQQTGSAASAAATLAAEYGRPRAEIEADVAELCARLSERGLVAIDPA